MLFFVLNLIFLLAIGLLGLMSTGGLPGGNRDANAAAERAAAGLAPFAGILGIIALVWGVVGLLNFITSLGGWFSAPVWGLLGLAVIVILIGLGLILSYPLLAQALAGSGGGKDALDRSLAAVKPYQRPLSIGAVAVAVLYLVVFILARAGVYL